MLTFAIDNGKKLLKSVGEIQVAYKAQTTLNRYQRLKAASVFQKQMVSATLSTGKCEYPLSYFL